MVVRYLRTNMLDIRVAGKQNTMTRISATARFTMKKLVTVLIRGERYTTAITKQFPISPTRNTSKYAAQYTAVIAPPCRYITSSEIISRSDRFSVTFIRSGWCRSRAPSMCVDSGSRSGSTLLSGTNLLFIASMMELDRMSTTLCLWLSLMCEWLWWRQWCRGS